jgi:hypothetical protein
MARSRWSGPLPAAALVLSGAVVRGVRAMITENPSPDGPPDGPRARHRLRWIALGAAVAVLATTAVGLTRHGDHPGPPLRWDPRVVELVRFVERQRGLHFDRPVRTEFLSEKDFRNEVTDDSELTDDEIEQLDHQEGLLRALGLVEGELDLHEAVNQLQGEGIIGLYDPDRERILIRGDRVTIGMQPTIVHELTHALQDQHFDIDPELHTTGETTAFTALVEADAIRVEDAYYRSLSADEQRAVDGADEGQSATLDLDGVPKILTEWFALPYVLGPPFVDDVARRGGNPAVNRAFRRRPTTEEHVVLPATYLAGQRAVRVPVPRTSTGERRVGEPEDFGMISLLLVLGERLPFNDAWAAASGWRGDASIGYRAKGKDCLRVRTRVDTGRDAAELLDGLRRWSAGRPTATATRNGTMVQFSSCDPGTATATNDPSRPRTFELLTLRRALTSSFEGNGLAPAVAECIADRVFHLHPPGELQAIAAATDPEDPLVIRVRREVVAATAACRGAG